MFIPSAGAHTSVRSQTKRVVPQSPSPATTFPRHRNSPSQFHFTPIMSASAWASIPWSSVPSPVDADGKSSIIGWHKRRVPYTPNGTYLQTLDVWIPNSDQQASCPSSAATSNRSQTGPWIVYIHGGAWRDPLVNSSSFEQTATNLLHASTAGELPFAGIVSLNYRLSPHPNHPTDPAPPKDPNASLDAARTVHHPDHIHDTLTALVFLQGLGVANDYILAGHSCGATMAFQVAMNPSRWGLSAGEAPKKPRVVVGLNGLYDLAAFMKKPDESHLKLVSVYDSFTRGAFGDDEKTWAAICPTVVEDWKTEWPEGERIVLVQSRSDSLVPYSQLQLMRQHLEQLAGGIKVDELGASGDHNELWQRGDELADILKQAVLDWKPRT
ncbi:Alpha/Beta hydrolase protein [Ilyonectria sp. MPI-CAGE-AT-0026]|nr:Alpha/Beta hydrolase protein [Ilyonectria sp. MPI-CAGE-AT-0026]